MKSPYDASLVGRVAKGDEALVDRAVQAAHQAFRGATSPSTKRAAVLDRAAGLAPERQSRSWRGRSPPRRASRSRPPRSRPPLRRHAHLLRGRGPQADRRHGADGGLRRRRRQARRHAARPLRRRRRDQPLQLPAQPRRPQARAGDRRRQRGRAQARRADPDRRPQAGRDPDRGRPARGLAQRHPGPARRVGNAMVEHELVKAITFTGSAKVGWGIRTEVPHKKVGLELGSNAPLIVNDDGDWQTAADKTRIYAFAHAGQVCISIQRILLHEASPTSSSSASTPMSRTSTSATRTTPQPMSAPDTMATGERVKALDRRGGSCRCRAACRRRAGRRGPLPGPDPAQRRRRKTPRSGARRPSDRWRRPTRLLLLRGGPGDGQHFSGTSPRISSANVFCCWVTS